jgi:hypothetical protein
MCVNSQISVAEMLANPLLQYRQSVGKELSQIQYLSRFFIHVGVAIEFTQ